MKTSTSTHSSTNHRGLVIKSLILVSLLSAALPSASAVTLYSTGFEDPPFANGSQLLGQDGWSLAIPPFLNPSAATITNTVAQSGLQSVRVRGADMVNAPEVDPLAAVGSYRRPLNYDTAAAGTPFVLIQSSVRLDGPVLGTGDFFSSNIAARIGDGFAGELSISSDGFVYGYDGTGDPARLFTAPITLNAWHTLGILVDFAANTFAFSVDGTSSSAFAFPSGVVSDVLVRESLVTYAYPDTATNHRSDFTAYYDNVSAVATPEPTSAVMLSLGGIALVSFRRRHASR